MPRTNALGFPGNDFLLLRDEPGYHGGEVLDVIDDYGEEVCHCCGGGEGNADGECYVCDPRVSLERTPVRASFEIETESGRVGWSGDCVASPWRPSLGHLRAWPYAHAPRCAFWETDGDCSCGAA